jgi:hypothetical protein
MQQKLLEKQQHASQQHEMAEAVQAQKQKDLEYQNKQQAIVQKKLEEARQKQEAERLARLEAEKKEEEQRRQEARAQQEREKERQAALALEKKAEARRIAERERQKIETMRTNEIKTVETLLAKASNERKQAKYLAAKNIYETVLQTTAASRFADDEKMMAYRRTAENALKADDIVYGSKGYVLYKDKWVSPRELEIIRYSEGYVRYKGALKDHKTLKNPIEKMTEPLVQKYLNGKYSGQTVHSKNIRFQKLVLTGSSDRSSEYSVYYKWKVWTFSGTDDDVCRIDIKYTVETDKWSLVKGCE